MLFKFMQFKFMHLVSAFKLCISISVFIYYYSMNSVIISNLTKLKINALDITGNSYITWAVDAKMHLRENEL